MLAKFFIDRPIFAWVIALLILLAGGLSLGKLPISAYPAVAPPQISVNIIYPGASSKVVEDAAVILIEQQLNGIEHLLYMESASEVGPGHHHAHLRSRHRPGRGLGRDAKPHQAHRAAPAAGSAARRHHRDEIRAQLPDVRLADLAGQEPGQRSARQLRRDQRAGPLLRVPGVGEAVLFGTEYSMRIWLKADRLYAYNLTPGDVTKAVNAQNAQLAMGELGQLPARPGSS